MTFVHWLWLGFFGGAALFLITALARWNVRIGVVAAVVTIVSGTALGMIGPHPPIETERCGSGMTSWDC